MKSNYKLKLLAVLLMLPALFFYSCKKDLSKGGPDVAKNTGATTVASRRQ